MTYAEAFKLSNPKYYDLAVCEGWLNDWEIADEHVRIADYDYANGIIKSVSAYDD